MTSSAFAEVTFPDQDAKILEHTPTLQLLNSFPEEARNASIVTLTRTVWEDIVSASMALLETAWNAGWKPQGTRTGPVWRLRATMVEHANQAYLNACAGWDTLGTTVNPIAHPQSI